MPGDDPLTGLHDKADAILDLQRSNADRIAVLESGGAPQESVPPEPPSNLPAAVECTVCGIKPSAGQVWCHNRDCPGRPR